MEAARVIAGELPDLPYLAELPGRGPGRGHHRPHRRAARRHPGRAGRAARLADRRAARPRPAPRQVDAVLRPGRDGGGARRVRGAAQGPAGRAVDARRDDRAAALAEGRRSPTPAWSPTSRPRWPKGPPRTSPRSPSGYPRRDHPRPARRARPARRRCTAAVPTPSGLSRVRAVDEEVRGRDCTRCSPPRGSTPWCIAVLATFRSG